MLTVESHFVCLCVCVLQLYPSLCEFAHVLSVDGPVKQRLETLAGELAKAADKELQVCAAGSSLRAADWWQLNGSSQPRACAASLPTSKNLNSICCHWDSVAAVQ